MYCQIFLLNSLIRLECCSPSSSPVVWTHCRMSVTIKSPFYIHTECSTTIVRGFAVRCNFILNSKYFWKIFRLYKLVFCNIFSKFKQKMLQFSFRIANTIEKIIDVEFRCVVLVWLYGTKIIYNMSRLNRVLFTQSSDKTSFGGALVSSLLLQSPRHYLAHCSH